MYEAYTKSSGVTVSDECKKCFDAIKQQKKHRYVVYHIKDERSIEVESIGDRDATYESFVEDLLKVGKDQCRYGLFDYEYTHKVQGAEPTKKEKLFLMMWSPDEAVIKSKMVYSSSFTAIKKALAGVSKYVEAKDLSDLDKEEVEGKLRSGDRS